MTAILIVLTSHATLGDTGRATGFYVSEAAHPWEVFTKAGHAVSVASVLGGDPPRDGDTAGHEDFLAFLGHDTPAVGDVDPSRFGAVFLAGGVMFTLTVLVGVYVQDIMGYSALRAGIGFIPFVVALGVGLGVSSALVSK